MRLSFHWKKRNPDSSSPKDVIREEGVSDLSSGNR